MGRVQPIDLWGLKSNCYGIVFPPISSTASKLLIDRPEMRPPIPGAHPAAVVQDGHREAGTDHTSHMCECVSVCVGACLCVWFSSGGGPLSVFAAKAKSPWVGSRLVPPTQ